MLWFHTAPERASDNAFKITPSQLPHQGAGLAAPCGPLAALVPGRYNAPVRRFIRFRDELRRLRAERQSLGWQGLLRRRGWKLVLVVFVFYLIRDLLLYVLLPLAVAAGLWR